jgi:hypothetical protein
MRKIETNPYGMCPASKKSTAGRNNEIQNKQKNLKWVLIKEWPLTSEFSEFEYSPK